MAEEPATEEDASASTTEEPTDDPSGAPDSDVDADQDAASDTAAPANLVSGLMSLAPAPHPEDEDAGEDAEAAPSVRGERESDAAEELLRISSARVQKRPSSAQVAQLIEGYNDDFLGPEDVPALRTAGLTARRETAVWPPATAHRRLLYDELMAQDNTTLFSLSS